MKAKHLLLTAALAGVTLAGTGCATQGAQAETGQCHGVNACKGQGDCSGKGHNCGGHNSCKGQGWLKTNAKECQAKGGQFLDKDGKPVQTEQDAPQQ
ncbi:hypothetical protein COW36_05830 [bacterium (Candidatus Blackallbacteria) CG17_big_fil_post_rev_8_21_14_2_50_48_46]|uniref:Lipoprotein n=1 Tax=bacterium (Candidatus Blackallbacteria) CG17_big_fil_post_rev_8_21_14_2_50_48_46 TaxID=2014261 RepID=A0A2M7G868_9BACT|nr:MAG: hypothetical protein COW64_21425 [bacterium (Candidatus Blackallbacteria) CG18_big_fil_WC_8_21_14_2_50_49_26]PIW18286.1 MAG: hypothetical protein COW36_05830 [bacterium (Candidatus Blackallbacteria) CG17_big_fil_post_rev_8_21_14_2_50_48_46]PIW49510.1 MAG: hypothetical protein COW20_05645 [bacterium (Candidatus Blackallbacteria) CG13_big_fil_rev_8_21_14_2_50_49_14]